MVFPIIYYPISRNLVTQKYIVFKVFGLFMATPYILLKPRDWPIITAIGSSSRNNISDANFAKVNLYHKGVL